MVTASLKAWAVTSEWVYFVISLSASAKFDGSEGAIVSALGAVLVADEEGGGIGGSEGLGDALRVELGEEVGRNWKEDDFLAKGWMGGWRYRVERVSVG